MIYVLWLKESVVKKEKNDQWFLRKVVNFLKNILSELKTLKGADIAMRIWKVGTLETDHKKLSILKVPAGECDFTSES